MTVVGRYNEALNHFDTALADYSFAVISKELNASMANLCRLKADLYQGRSQSTFALEWLNMGIWRILAQNTYINRIITIK